MVVVAVAVYVGFCCRFGVMMARIGGWDGPREGSH